jgi:hypothetical protein
VTPGVVTRRLALQYKDQKKQCDEPDRHGACKGNGAASEPETDAGSACQPSATADPQGSTGLTVCTTAFYRALRTGRRVSSEYMVGFRLTSASVDPGGPNVTRPVRTPDFGCDERKRSVSNSASF